ncbi:MAG: DHA2 family efflux MFS transporter permease subunit [Candidatus Tectomicrobia bacterium]|nr:DHA2 family efflux MFS transporter permease subunit [Candidatus Tectomicrobia bacterium]
MASTGQDASGAQTILPLDTHKPTYKWLVASTILIAGATQIFSGTSVNIAIPRLMSAFGSDLATTQWVATVYLLSRTLVIPLLGWMGNMFGNRNLFIMMMSGFVLTSLGCGLSTSLPMLIAVRAVQGLVMGGMEGLTAVMLVQAFPSRQRGLALGLRPIGWSVGQILFYTLGGYLLEQISWRMIFFLGIPTGVLSVMMGWLILPRNQEPRQDIPVDYIGLLCLGGFLIPLLLAISFGRNSETAASTLILLTLVALIGSVLFVGWELRTPHPVVTLRLFRIPAFSLVCASAFLNGLGLFGAQFMVPIFLQQVIGLTPLQAGLVIVPALLFSAVSGVLTGRLTDMMPAPFIILGGMLALAIIFFQFASISVLTAMTVIVIFVILYRICMNAIFTPLTALNVQVLAADQVRMGQGLLGVVRSIGSSLGVTVTSVFFERRRILHQGWAYEQYNDAALAHGEAVQSLRDSLHQAGMVGSAVDRAALRTIRQQMDIEAIAAGFRESFVLIGGFFLCASIPMWGLIAYTFYTRKRKEADG